MSEPVLNPAGRARNNIRSLITKGNDMKKGMRIAAAVMAAAFSMTVLAGCGKSETKTAETTAAASADNSSAVETTASNKPV